VFEVCVAEFIKVMNARWVVGLEKLVIPRERERERERIYGINICRLRGWFNY
jgi:hypothetical protein